MTYFRHAERETTEFTGLRCSALGCEMQRKGEAPFCTYHWQRLNYSFRVEYCRMISDVRRGVQARARPRRALILEAVIVLAEQEHRLVPGVVQKMAPRTIPLRPWF